jgi:PAS domain S-box-containing protein
MTKNIPPAIMVLACAGLVLLIVLEYFYPARYSSVLYAQHALIFRSLLITLLAIFITVSIYIVGRATRSIHIPDKVFISEEWFMKMMLSMDEAIIVTNDKGSITSMNKKAEELTGWTLPESLGKPIDLIFDTINDHTELPMESPIKRVLKENRMALLENHTILVKKDKTQRYIVDSAIPIHDSHSSVIGSVLIFRDITELTMSRKKLIEKEELLNGIIENTGVLIDVMNVEGKFLLRNRQFRKVFNIDSASRGEKKATDDVKEEQHAGLSTMDYQVLKQNRLLAYMQSIHHADGTVHNYHTSKFPLHNAKGDVCAICTISVDSDSEKNNEMDDALVQRDVLRKNGMHHHVHIQNMPSIFFSLDRGLRFTNCNEACEKFTGRRADQILGKELKDAFPDIPSLFLTAYYEVINTGVDKDFVLDFVYGLTPFVFRVNIYQTVKGISVLLHDLTGQREAEAEARDVLEKLRTKNSELQQFAYALSHDLRTPIARILGLVSLAAIDPSFKIKDKTILENVNEQVLDLDNVIKDMNATITLQDGKKERYVDFEDELMLIKKVLETEIAHSKAVVSSSFQNAEGVVTIKSHLYSIMYNLMSNALKYRRPHIPVVIDWETQQIDGFILLSVKDNGMGMDLEKNGKKLFELFSRFHGDKIEGKGIGLNLVKSQAEALGGRVEVQSVLGKGSIFTVFLPVLPT